MTDDPSHKSYLGDGAYVQLGSFATETLLTTEDGVNVQNRVVLGPMEIKLLLVWLRQRQIIGTEDKETTA